MAVVTMRQLLESGVHFGHQTRRWNPKMKRFIFTERNGIYIIDLQQSLTFIDKAFNFVKETVAHGGTILFVGTKKQAQEAVAEQAARVGMPFVNQRWLGGMLTNFQTVNKRLTRLKELEAMDLDDVAASTHTKKELLMMRREKDKLERTLGGIRTMAKTPSAVWIVDTKKEHLAVDEARKLGIPVVAILDTNCDPDEVDYAIPGNDDAIRAVSVLTRVIADAAAEGLIDRHNRKAQTAAKEGEEVAPAEAEPLTEWERDLLQGGDEPAADAAAPAEAAAQPAADQAPAVSADPALDEAAAKGKAAEAAIAEAAAAEVVAEESVAEADAVAEQAASVIAAEERAVETAEAQAEAAVDRADLTAEAARDAAQEANAAAAAAVDATEAESLVAEAQEIAAEAAPVAGDAGSDATEADAPADDEPKAATKPQTRTAKPKAAKPEASSDDQAADDKSADDKPAD